MPRGGMSMNAREGDMMMMVEPGNLPAHGPTLLAALLGSLGGGGMMPGHGTQYVPCSYVLFTSLTHE